VKRIRFWAPLLALTFVSFETAEAFSQNALLRELAKEDQDSRRGQEVIRTDQDRIKLVLPLVGRGAAITPEDKFNAALVLQHTPLTFCDGKLQSFSPDNYLLAHSLFESALEAGFEDARYLVAASIDRYLVYTEGYQKYGTQRVINQETGKEELVPIDRKTTDEERAKYGVPGLAELLKEFPEQAPAKK